MVYVPGNEEKENNEALSNREVGGTNTRNKDLLITGSADHNIIIWCFESGSQVLYPTTSTLLSQN